MIGHDNFLIVSKVDAITIDKEESALMSSTGNYDINRNTAEMSIKYQKMNELRSHIESFGIIVDDIKCDYSRNMDDFSTLYIFTIDSPDKRAVMKYKLCNTSKDFICF